MPERKNGERPYLAPSKTQFSTPFFRYFRPTNPTILIPNSTLNPFKIENTNDQDASVRLSSSHI